MTAYSLVPTAEINTGIRAHVSVSEAARRLGVSETTVRRAIRALGVTRVSGRTVAGGILIDASPVPMVIAYAR